MYSHKLIMNGIKLNTHTSCIVVGMLCPFACLALIHLSESELNPVNRVVMLREGRRLYCIALKSNRGGTTTINGLVQQAAVGWRKEKKG